MTRINEADVEWSTSDRGVDLSRKKLSAAAGGDELGCSRYRLPPGGRSGPYHYHTANEEAIYVLEGSATLRLAGEAHDLGPGDYVVLPADDSGAHRIYNDGEETLHYLIFSTMVEPDVTVYPDSDVVKLNVGAAPGGDGERALDGCYDREATVEWPGGDDDWHPD